jgi:voltage-gated potassium channel
MIVETETQNRRSGPTLHDLANYDLFILVLTIFSMIVMVGILLPGNPAGQAALVFADFLICVVFLVDFFIQLRRAPHKINYFVKKGGWLDLLGSIPAIPGFSWTVLYRLGRINRPVQMWRRLRREDRDEAAPKRRENPAGTVLLTTILLAIILLTLGSLLVLRVERFAEDATITNGAVAFWWAFVTMTTVGYGDFVPVTYTGRVLAIGLMTFGIGVFAVLTSFLASKFALSQDDQGDIETVIKEENAQIRAEIAELRALIKQQHDIDE